MVVFQPLCLLKVSEDEDAVSSAVERSSEDMHRRSESESPDECSSYTKSGNKRNFTTKQQSVLSACYNTRMKGIGEHSLLRLRKQQERLT